MFMRTSPTGTYDPLDLIPSTWIINYCFIDTNTRVLSPIITTNVGVIKPNIVKTNLETNATIEAADTYLSTSTALVIMNAYEPKALMRFTVTLSLNGLSAKANTLIDTTTSHNFVSKDFLWPMVFTKIVRLLLKWL